MEKLLDNKTSPVLVGFYQSLGVIVYVILVATLMNTLQGSDIKPPEIVAAPLILTLLVLSAGVTGTLVFGLAVYLTFAKNNLKRAVSILGYTFAFLFIAILFSAFAILSLY